MVIMLELIFAFGAGAVASSWLHRKARKRAQTRHPSPVTLAPPPPHRGPLSGSARAAAILMSFPPEVSARLFNEIAPEDVQRITLEITQLPVINPGLRAQILGEFCASVGIAPDRLEEAAIEEPALIAKALTLLSHLPPALSA